MTAQITHCPAEDDKFEFDLSLTAAGDALKPKTYKGSWTGCTIDARGMTCDAVAGDPLSGKTNMLSLKEAGLDGGIATIESVKVRVSDGAIQFQNVSLNSAAIDSQSPCNNSAISCRVDEMASGVLTYT